MRNSAHDGVPGTGSATSAQDQPAPDAPPTRTNGDGSAGAGAAGPSEPPPSERQARGRALRAHVPRSSHAQWTPPPDRPDPISVLEAQAQSRLPDLVPIRYGRMLTSPLAFLRGAAAVMACDLASTASTDLSVQLCGDCHLANFGVYASPERALLFDINDFDESLPGPWEWDVKRLAVSFVVAGRTYGVRPADARAAAVRVAQSYRTHLQAYAQMRNLEVWYARVSVDEIMALTTRRRRPAAHHALVERAQRQDHLRALNKLTTSTNGRQRIISDPPLIVPVDSATLRQDVEQVVRSYRATLQDDRRHLLHQYRLVDLALKVVGVGSVGTRCFIALLEGRDDQDPLFLQVKEAEASVLETYLPAARYRNHGHRVVAGQHLMQASSDIFLGWTRGSDGRDYYVRQLRDMKSTVVLEDLFLADWLLYAEVCGWTLARAHARSGDRIQIAAYLGTGPRFDQAIADFAESYAEQTERDHAALTAAVRSGRITAAANT